MGATVDGKEYPGGDSGHPVQVTGTATITGTITANQGTAGTGAWPFSAADGAIATLGTTSDASSASTTIGLLKALKAQLSPSGFGALPATVLSSSATALGAGIFATMTDYGWLRTSNEPHDLFADTFDGGVVDTTNRWTAGGTVTPTQSGGVLTVSAGTANDASSSLASQHAFAESGVGLQALGVVVQLEATTIATNKHRFWGWGTQPGTWAAGTPLQDAVGFEVTTGGALAAVIYSGGARHQIAALTVPTDGNYHRYLVIRRTDHYAWYQDGLEIPVAVQDVALAGAAYAVPQVEALPIRLHDINATGVTGAPVFNVQAVGSGDTAGNGIYLVDGTYPWRRTSVSSTGGLGVNLANVGGSVINIGQASMAGSLPVVIASNQSSVGVDLTQSLPAGTNVIGAVTQSAGPWTQNLTEIAGSAVAVAAAGIMKVGLTDGAGSAVDKGQGTMAGSLPVAIASDQSNVPVAQATAASLNATVVQGTAAALSGAWPAKITDGTNAAGVAAASTALAATAPALGVALSPNTPLPAGTNSIGNIGTVAAVTAITDALPAGTNAIGTVTANQGTAAALSGAWPAKVTDGTNVAGVAAASTALAATAPALGVALSPNTPLPAGTNSIGNIGTVAAVTAITDALPAGTNAIGAVTQSAGPWSQNLTQVGGASLALGQTTKAGSLPVALASDQMPNSMATANVPGTQTSVAAASSATALLSNLSRTYASVFNSGTVPLNVGLGFTPSATVMVAQIAPGGLYVVPTVPPGDVWTGTVVIFNPSSSTAGTFNTFEAQK